MSSSGASAIDVQTTLESAAESPQAATPAQPCFPVGTNTPLHLSPIWSALTAPPADASKSTSGAPLLVASNAYLASAYARVLLAYIRDWFVRPEAVHDEPIFIIDFLAGRGRLPFLILRELVESAELWPDAGAPPVSPGTRRCPFLFVCADPDGALIDAAEKHEAFSRFVDAGLVAFATWDASKSGETLYLRATPVRPARDVKQGSLKNTVIALGNYATSSLCSSVIQYHDGVMHEAHAALFSSDEGDSSRLEALPREIFGRLRVEWTFEPVNPSHVCDGFNHPDVKAHIAGLAAYYAGSLPSATVPMPLGAMALASNISLLTEKSPSLILLGDKAYAHAPEMIGHREPHLAFHNGGASLMGNLDALRLWALSRGGAGLVTPYLDGEFKCALLYVPSKTRTPAPLNSRALQEAALMRLPTELLAPGGIRETAAAWADAFDGFGPDSFATLQRCLRDEIASPSLKLALSTLRLAAWDPEVFVKFRDVIITLAPSAPERLQADIYRDVTKVYERFYPLSSDCDVSFDCGRILMGLRQYAEAVSLFLASLRQTGEHHVTVYNIGICLFHVKRYRTARAAFQRSIELNGAYRDAASWLTRVEQQIAALAATEIRSQSLAEGIVQPPPIQQTDAYELLNTVEKTN